MNINRDSKGRFIKGHVLSNGHKVSKKTKTKISNSLLGHIRTKESIKKQQEAWKIKMKEGYISPHCGDVGYYKGKHLPDDMRQSISDGLKQKYASGELINGFKGKKHSVRAKKIIGQKAKKRHKEHPQVLSETHKEALRLSQLKYHKGPNKLEKDVQKALEKLYPNEWAFNGNYDCGITIDGMIPDFVNINGEKWIIEVFGDYWHRNDNGIRRIERYKKFGYQCVILREKDLRTDIERTVKEGVIDV